MAKFNYGKMQATASRLLAKYAQGVITYTPPPTTGGDPWNPTQTPSTPITIDATAQGVSAEYVDGTTVLATDLQITSAVFSQAPSMAGKITADGKVLQMIRIIPLPAAGVTVAWRVIVRA